MINRLKKLLEAVKSSKFMQPIKGIKNWFQENIVKRKLLIFSVIFTAWLSLLLGALYSPQRQTYSDEQLKTKRTFENGTGEIKLTSQTYSPETGVVVLQFETIDSTSSVDRGIDTKRLKWKLYAQNRSPKTTMEVVPIVDNKISVIIRNVPKDFGAYAIDIINSTVSVNGIDVDISSSSEEEKAAKKSEEKGSNVVQFFVTPLNSKLKKEKIEEVSREEFTLQEIASELQFQEKQINKLQSSITQLKSSIEDDESRKEGLLKEAQYLSDDELEDNQKDIAAIESNIETKNKNIETANGNIEKVQTKIATLKKKEAAVKDGTFEFSNPIETVKLK